MNLIGNFPFDPIVKMLDWVRYHLIK